MKKSYILKTIIVILLVFFALSLAGCTVANSYVYSEISASEDGQTIQITSPDGMEEKVYLYVGMISGTLYGERFLYENYVIFADGSIGDVYSPLEERDVLYVDVGGDVYCYVKKNADTARGEVSDFLSGKVSRVSLANTTNFRESVLNDSEIERFFAPPTSENLIEVDVRTLKNALYYDVLGYDSYLALTKTVGAIFTVNGRYLFVNFANLDNSAFDAYGNLSYRQGIIEAEVLCGDKLTILEALGGRKKHMNDDIKYETGLYIGDETEDEASHPLSIVLTLIFTLLLPIIPAGYLIRFLLGRRRLALETGEKRAIPIPLLVMVAGGLLWLIAGLCVLYILAFL